MATRELGIEGGEALEQVLGFLNFSSGSGDPQFFSNINQLFELIVGSESGEPTWRAFGDLLSTKLAELKESSPTFRDADQAAAVIELIFDRVLPDYLEFHRDSLFHQTAETLFGPFFLGRVCEAVLRAGAPWHEADRISADAIGKLNDYIGHRPVATLETQKIEPYPHEWVRPIPLYIRDVGVAVGPHREVVEKALLLLEETDEDLLRSAHFNADSLDELAIDPRAYDFDHPVNKRPNYHFGQWDPHHIDNQGRYRRMVVQQVTLDALMQRVEEPGDLPLDEVILEAASVLAGTILMASGISGSGPDTHDSSVTLTSLLPEIAAYRDAFYERLFTKMTGAHAKRLEMEAAERRQPFGGARQHLNAQLARRRASQLEHVHLAMIFARMGYPQSAAQQAAVVPVASARMRCRIDCRLTAGVQAIENGELERAGDLLGEIVDLLHRSIECGAFIDPWNILGFDAHFSLFPALENSIHDHRADELIDLMEDIFAFYSFIWSEAAAVDNQALCEQISKDFKENSQWWRQFAVHEVSTVEASDPSDAFYAAEHVAKALNLWHKGGAATGDVGFWAPHAEMFGSGKAYALVVDALLQRDDFVASMALLMHWLSQAERVGLEYGDRSFHGLTECWLSKLRESATQGDPDEPDSASAGIWPMVKKFFDYLEANAEEYWRAPSFALSSSARSRKETPSAEAVDDDDEDDEDDDLFSAAYENVVYRDSTDDGVDGGLLDTGTSYDELEYESKRIADRLEFLSTVARLWTVVATSPSFLPQVPEEDGSEMTSLAEAIQHWVIEASQNRHDLLGLLNAVENHEIPAPSGDHDSMVEYDRRRLTKESLLEQIVSTCVETADSLRHLLAAATAYRETNEETGNLSRRDEDEFQAITVFGCMLRGDVDGVRRHWPNLIEALAANPLLYVPLAKGGDARKIVRARVRQRSIQDLLAWLPRLGLLTETRQLLDTAREMERDHPVGAGAVTEFDELFKIGYKSVVQCLVASASTWPEAEQDASDDEPTSRSNLIDCLEKATELLLVSWLAHSRTLRLSVLERVKGKDAWNSLVAFIEHYGEELFTQKFFNLGNLRAILHEGVDVWLEQLEEQAGEHSVSRLLDDLHDNSKREEAVDHLSLILEAIVENYGEYRDYNSTTTQSDRGQLLYMLLDFLRLRTDYDRVAWNLRPVVWAHEILVRRGHNETAKMWRRTLTERIGEEADKYATRLTKLQKQYAMRMPTVADRIGERFIRPMLIDRIRALIEPAIQGAGNDKPPKEFEILEYETATLTREPTGVGLDVPAWLMALEDEVEEVRRPSHGNNGVAQDSVIPQITVPLEEIRRQIDEWAKKD